jgi:hypothetical protein
MTTFTRRPPSFATLTATGLLLVAAADLLLFDHPLGLSLVAFAVLVGMVATASNPAPVRRSIASALALLAGLTPLAENISALSVAVAVLSLAAFALARTGRLATLPVEVAGHLVVFLAAAPLRFVADYATRRAAARRRAGRGGNLVRLVGWVMPVGLALVFVALLGAANPIIDRWLALVDPGALLNLVEIRRALFWLLVFLAVWPLLRPRLPKWFGSSRRAARENRTQISVPAMPDRLAELLFGRTAILRALAIFNAIFAVQTLLDGLYLWGGIALPDGLTYAAYAHRGAYPLVATALVAAAFVLLAMRPGSGVSADPTIRRLVYLWTGQNVVLVVSSILRLDLYVDVYSLTYWRVAAFVWMALVAAGLLSILARIGLDRSNRWLVNANLAMLAATLFACCFVNFAALIADFNVAHSRQMGGEGSELDLAYLVSIGPAAVPAIDRILVRQPYWMGPERSWLFEERQVLAAGHQFGMRDWRGWTFRAVRLSRYLDASEPQTPAGLGPDLWRQ